MLLQISVVYQTGNLPFTAYANWHINIQYIYSKSKKPQYQIWNTISYKC